MESLDFLRGETTGPTMPKSSSTFLMSSFVSHKSQSGSKVKVHRESTSGGTYFSKYRRSAYKPSGMYKASSDAEEVSKYGAAPEKRGKSTSISHSSAYYRKKSKKKKSEVSGQRMKISEHDHSYVEGSFTTPPNAFSKARNKGFSKTRPQYEEINHKIEMLSKEIEIETQDLITLRHEKRKEKLNAIKVEDECACDELGNDEDHARIPTKTKSKKEFSYKYYKYVRSKEENKRQAEMPRSIKGVSTQKKTIEKDEYYSPSPRKGIKYGHCSQKKGFKYGYNHTSTKKKSIKKTKKIETIRDSSKCMKKLAFDLKQNKGLRSVKGEGSLSKSRVRVSSFARKPKPKYYKKEEKSSILCNLQDDVMQYICSFYSKFARKSNINEIRTQCNNKKSFHDMENDKVKIPHDARLLDLFTDEGKGGVVQVIGEPLFPLKPTLDYLTNSILEGRLEINKALQTSKNNLLGISVNFSTKQSNAEVEVLVEGKLCNSSSSKSSETFKHEFKLRPDDRYGYKCSSLKVYENSS
ncbi:unnamed protein product [Moneuplotes crassus]|uniref:Uncharacterized protein n=1 Tax=Euplotes crassus TaxID=5936 RepID=A0AAD1X645_EUPCR|nr:unnamed protein product [Moneuplotes crassus]